MAFISLRVRPGSSRDAIALDGKLLRIQLTAAPVDGKANQRLLRLLAQRLGVRQSDLSIVRGQTSRDKLVEVARLSDVELWRRLREPE